MKLGIRSHDLKLQEDFLNSENINSRLNDYDIDGLQLVCFKTFKDIKQMPKSISLDFVEKLSDDIKKCNKEVILIGSYFNPVHSNKEKVENCLQVFKEYLGYATTFNTKVVASETGSFNDDKWTYHPSNRTKDALNTVIKTFSTLVQFAEKSNSIVGMEGAAGHVCYSVDVLKSAIDSIGSKNNLKVVFDLYNFLDSDNVSDHFKILEHGLNTFDKRIHCFHLKDFIIENGVVKQVPIGKGILDYKKYISILKQYDSNANLILEGTVKENILPSVKLVRELWKSV